MKFSFILCTINRYEDLIKSIKSIINTNYDNLEIVVIDQSDNAHEDISSLDNRIIYKHIDVKGLSHARNVAIELATGDYCCIMDDDAEYEQNALNIAKKYIEQKKLDVLSGIIIDKNSLKRWSKSMPYRDLELTLKNVFFCASASLIIKTSLLYKYKFDEMLGAGKRWGCGEETDLLLRLLYDDCKIFYTSKLIIYHPYIEKEDNNLDKVLKYNLGFGAFYAKHIKKYNNKSMKYKYKYCLLKNYIAKVLYFILNKKNMVNYYDKCIKGKRTGYMEWLENEIKN